MTNDFKTYSLEQVAAMVLPEDWKDGARWLRNKLKKGEISGYRVGRVWRMTHQDVEDLLENGRRRPSSAPPEDPLTTSSIIDGLSPRARRRLMTQPERHPSGLSARSRRLRGME